MDHPKHTVSLTDHCFTSTTHACPRTRYIVLYQTEICRREIEEFRPRRPGPHGSEDQAHKVQWYDPPVVHAPKELQGDEIDRIVARACSSSCLGAAGTHYREQPRARCQTEAANKLSRPHRIAFDQLIRHGRMVGGSITHAPPARRHRHTPGLDLDRPAGTYVRRHGPCIASHRPAGRPSTRKHACKRSKQKESW